MVLAKGKLLAGHAFAIVECTLRGQRQLLVVALGEVFQCAHGGRVAELGIRCMVDEGIGRMQPGLAVGVGIGCNRDDGVGGAWVP